MKDIVHACDGSFNLTLIFELECCMFLFYCYHSIHLIIFKNSKQCCYSSSGSTDLPDFIYWEEQVQHKRMIEEVKHRWSYSFWTKVCIVCYRSYLSIYPFFFYLSYILYIHTNYDVS